MTLKLNGSTAGSVSIDAPADTSPTGTDVTLTLPTSAGSSGEVLTTNGSGTLSWASTSSDSITEGNTSAEVVDTGSDGHFKVITEGTERFRIANDAVYTFTGGNSASDPGEIILSGRNSSDLTRPAGKFLIGPNGTDSWTGEFTLQLRDDGGTFQDRFHVSGKTGNVGIDTTSPQTTLQIGDASSGNGDPKLRLHRGSGSDYFELDCLSGAPRLHAVGGGDMKFFTGSSERLKLTGSGDVYSVGIYNQGSSWAANVGVGSNGILYRSTSSIKYKTDVETLQDSYADALLECRPVWYHSLCENDNPEHSFWGFIAEEVAEIDPRLVHWKTFEVTYDENGSAVETPCDPEPEGVAYDRFVPHLINLVKRQKEQLESQAATIAALDARLTALEGGAS